MTLEEIQAKLTAGIKDSNVKITGDGCNCAALVVSPIFKDMSLLKRQKMVLTIMSKEIKNGTLHALTIKTRTPEENI